MVATARLEVVGTGVRRRGMGRGMRRRLRSAVLARVDGYVQLVAMGTSWCSPIRCGVRSELQKNLRISCIQKCYLGNGQLYQAKNKKSSILFALQYFRGGGLEHCKHLVNKNKHIEPQLKFTDSYKYVCMAYLLVI